MPRSRHRVQRTAPPTPASQLPRLLQHHPPASVPPQRKPPSAGSAHASGQAHRCDSAGRRTASPVPARCLSVAGFSGYPPRPSRDGGRPIAFRRPSVFLTPACVPWPPRHADSPTPLTSDSGQARPRMRFVTGTGLRCSVSTGSKKAKTPSKRHCAARGVSQPSPMSCAPRQASRGYGVNRAGGRKLSICSRRFTAGSPRASTPPV